MGKITPEAVLLICFIGLAFATLVSDRIVLGCGIDGPGAEIEKTDKSPGSVAAEKSGGCTAVKRTVLAAWGLFAGAVLSVLVWRGKRNKTVLVLLAVLFAGILAGAVMPSKMKNGITGRTRIYIVEHVEWLEPVVAGNVEKIGHFVCFLMLGAVLLLIVGKDGRFPAVLYILMIAGGTEMAQFFIENRSPFISDFLIDTAGGVAGLSLISLKSGSKE